MMLGRLSGPLSFLFSGHLAVFTLHQYVCLAFLVPFHLALWGMFFSVFLVKTELNYWFSTVFLLLICHHCAV